MFTILVIQKIEYNTYFNFRMLLYRDIIIYAIIYNRQSIFIMIIYEAGTIVTVARKEHKMRPFP